MNNINAKMYNLLSKIKKYILLILIPSFSFYIQESISPWKRLDSFSIYEFGFSTFLI